MNASTRAFEPAMAHDTARLIVRSALARPNPYNMEGDYLASVCQMVADGRVAPGVLPTLDHMDAQSAGEAEGDRLTAAIGGKFSSDRTTEIPGAYPAETGRNLRRLALAFADAWVAEAEVAGPIVFQLKRTLEGHLERSCAEAAEAILSRVTPQSPYQSTLRPSLF